MGSPACAIRIKEENFNAILSEAGRKFNREFLENWHYEHGEGFFLREANSALDCSLFTPLAFEEMYELKQPDDHVSLLLDINKL